MPPKTKPRTRRKTATTNALAAEAAPNQFELVFTWRGQLFRLDTREVKYGAVAWKLRVVGDEQRTLFERANAMIDVMESALGQEQVAKLVELEPRIFDDPEAMSSFWQEFTRAATGGTPGESSAS